MIGHLFEKGDPKLDYVLKEISSYLGLSIEPVVGNEPEIVLVGNGYKHNSDRSASYIHFSRPLSMEDFEPIVKDWFKWKGFKVPVFNRVSIKGEPFLKDENERSLISITEGPGIIADIGFDILTPVFYFLSGTEEMVCEECDQFERFSHTFSVLFKEGLLHTPIVTIYMDIFLTIIKEITLRKGSTFARVWPWPEGKEYALGLSHDTDEIKRHTLKKSAGYALNKDLSNSITSLKGSIENIDSNDYWTFNDIMNIEMKYGASSSFYFSGLTNKDRASRKDKRRMELAYTTDDRRIKELYKEISDKGWEVGLHSSFTAKNDGKTLKRERENISKLTGRSTSGIRQHFLRFKLADYIVGLRKAGFKYDTSMGYSTQSGFRSGTCYPYGLLDPESLKASGVMEIPLAIMEGTLSDKMRIDPKRSSSKAMKLIENIRMFNGGCSILWHNNRFFKDEFPGWGEAYELIIKASIAQNAYVTSLENIWSWISKKDQVCLECNGTSLKITSKNNLKDLTIEIAREGNMIPPGKDFDIISTTGERTMILITTPNKKEISIKLE